MRALPGQKGGRWRYSQTLNKAVNVSETPVMVGDMQEDGGKVGVFCRGRRGKCMREEEER